MRVIIGGTFAHLHKGHETLIRKAFAVGSYVYIGLTTDRYVSEKKPGRAIPAYAKRELELARLVDRLGKRYDILPLSDRFGPSTTGDFDAIVVSDETKATAVEINRIRRGNGLEPLRIINIGYVLAVDSGRISSTRISKGEIHDDGSRGKTKDTKRQSRHRK